MAKALQQLADTIKNGQRSLAEAGQGQPQSGSPSGGDQLASGGQGKSAGQLGSPGNGGMGPTPGLGNGGSGGKQEPLNHAGRDELAAGRSDPKGPQTASFYKDQPDANPSSAAAYAATPGFRKQAEAALRREQVPPTYRRQVKDYFDSIRR